MKTTQQLANLGQSLWLDNISRGGLQGPMAATGVNVGALAAKLQHDSAQASVMSWQEPLARTTDKIAALADS